jgi:uncharacterized protein (DUF1499 family)
MMVKTNLCREIMKMTKYWLMGIVLALGLLMMGIALFAKGQARVGLMAGKLSLCPNTPNCVCSEDASTSSYIEPLIFSGEVFSGEVFSDEVFNGSADSAWQRIKQVVVSSGGHIQTEEQGYLWAIFTTKWLRFVDDVELRMDVDSHVIHIRSASRVGRSDFGVNRERVEMLRLLLNSSPSASVTADP